MCQYPHYRKLSSGQNRTLHICTGIKLHVISTASPNIFAALTLMHRDAQETRGRPQARMRRKLDGYRRILRQGYTPDEIRTLLRLMEYLLRLPSELTRPTVAAMKQIASEEIGMTLVTSFEEIGREDGRIEGRVEGRIEERQALVLRLLTRKFGSLPEEVSTRITGLDSDTVLILQELRGRFQPQASAGTTGPIRLRQGGT